jgi:hypothetical protein
MSHFLEVKENSFISNIKINKYNSNTLQDSTNINTGDIFTDLYGSEFTIIPASGSDYVYYEYNFSMCEDSAVSYATLIAVRLEYSTNSGSSWTEFVDSMVSFGTYQNGLIRKNVFNYRQLIPVWGQTERMIKATCTKLTSNNGSQLHKLNDFYNTSGLASSNYYYRPFAICYEITN